MNAGANHAVFAHMSDIADDVRELQRTHAFEFAEPALLFFENNALTGRSGDLEAKVAALGRAARLLEEQGQLRAAAFASTILMSSTIVLGSMADAEEAAERTLRLTQSHGFLEEEETATWCLALIATMRGDLQASAELTDRLRRGHSHMEGWVLPLGPEYEGRLRPEDVPSLDLAASIPAWTMMLRAIRARLFTRLGQSERAIEELAALFEGVELLDPNAISLANIASSTAFAVLAHGSPAQLESVHKWAIGVPSRLSGTDPFPSDSVRGMLALALGEIDEAEAHFLSGVEWWEREGVGPLLGQCLQGLAEVAERRGERQQAMQYLDRAGELFSRHGAKFYLDQVLAKKEILKA
jgi:tetratricopeptide (TPR) repeat protein